MNIFKNLGYHFAAIVLLFLGFISKNLSFTHRIAFGKLLGNLIRLISPKRKNITLTNLNACFPEKSKQEIYSIMQQSYHNLGITLSELLAFPILTDEEVKEIVKFEDIEQLKSACESGRGVIMLSAHYGNWELLAYAGRIWLDFPMLIPVKRQRNPVIDKILSDYRTMNGNIIVDMAKAALPIVKHLKKGGALALLADQAANIDKDIKVEFFGKPSITYQAPAELALKFAVPLFICFAERQDDGTYLIRQNHINFDDLQYSKEAVLELTQRHVNILEKAIRHKPGLWAWQHKRWKNIENWY